MMTMERIEARPTTPATKTPHPAPTEVELRRELADAIANREAATPAPAPAPPSMHSTRPERSCVRLARKSPMVDIGQDLARVPASTQKPPKGRSPPWATCRHFAQPASLRAVRGSYTKADLDRYVTTEAESILGHVR